MAMSLPCYNQPDRRREHLTCSLCRDVFRSPRFLPNCLHTFCLPCLEDLTRTKGRMFPCPVCRTSTRVPDGGVSKFKVNFYIMEEDLERERNRASRPMCKTHPMEELIFFCKLDELPICTRCKLTKHENHPTEDLSETANNCRTELQKQKKQLKKKVQRVSKISVVAHDNQKAALDKAVLLKDMIHEQHKVIVDMVTERRDQALHDLESVSQTIDNDFNSHINSAQRHLDALTQLRQRMSHAINNNNDAEVMEVEREMRDGDGGVQGVEEMEKSLISSTTRPGVQGQVNVFTPQVLDILFGTPVILHLPCTPPTEVVTPVYRCEAIHGCREIHAVYHFNVYSEQDYLKEPSIVLAYGGKAPDYADETVITINKSGKKIGPSTPVKKKVSVIGPARFTPNKAFSCIANDDAIYPKSFTDTRLVVQRSPPKLTVESYNVPWKTRDNKITFDLKGVSTPLAFDTLVGDHAFVVLNEDRTSETPKNDAITVSRLQASTSRPTELSKRTVQLYLKNQSQPVCEYIPPQQPFFPTDVCFWRGPEHPQLLLISDLATDSVHMVSVENSRLKFLRYLASGSPRIVRPTALDWFRGSPVWIGCENGWLLRCDSLSHEDTDEKEDESDESDDSDEESQQIHVENESGSTSETRSGSFV